MVVPQVIYKVTHVYEVVQVVDYDHIYAYQLVMKIVSLHTCVCLYVYRKGRFRKIIIVIVVCTYVHNTKLLKFSII